MYTVCKLLLVEEHLRALISHNSDPIYYDVLLPAGSIVTVVSPVQMVSVVQFPLPSVYKGTSINENLWYSFSVPSWLNDFIIILTGIAKFYPLKWER